MKIKLLCYVWAVQLVIHYCVWYELHLFWAIIWSLVSLLLLLIIIASDMIKLYRLNWKAMPIGIITVTSLYLLTAITQFGSEIGAYIKFKRHEQEYTQMVNFIVNGNDANCHYPECKIDDGPPIRVAFSWGGLLDNWAGICYDPSGEISKASHSYASSIRHLFEGDLVSTSRLQKNWYFCAFT